MFKNKFEGFPKTDYNSNIESGIPNFSEIILIWKCFFLSMYHKRKKIFNKLTDEWVNEVKERVEYEGNECSSIFVVRVNF